MFEKVSVDQNFYMAAGEGNLPGCKELIESLHVDINGAHNSFSRTALHWAAINNQVDVVRYLIGRGAILTFDKDGRSPYDLTTTPEIRRVFAYEGRGEGCCRQHKIPAIDFLTYGYQHTVPLPVITKAITDCKDIEQFRGFMATYQLTPDSYYRGIPLLLLASYNYSFSSEILRFLLKNGANPRAKAHPAEHDAYESTALHYLLANECVKRARIFIILASKLSCGIDSKIQDVEGKTILHIATLLRDADFLEFCLLRLGSSAIHIQDDLGRTPLHYAVLFGDRKSVETLMNHGADFRLVDKQGLTPEDLFRLPLYEVRKALLRFHVDPLRSCRVNVESKFYHAMQESANSEQPDLSIMALCIRNRIALSETLPQLLSQQSNACSTTAYAL